VLTINQRKHESSILPKNIIWFQLSGLSQEHLALVKTNHIEEKVIGFEQMTCPGILWTYSLSDLRPEPLAASFIQLFGTANVEGNCQDYNKFNLAQFANEQGLESIVLEHGFFEDKDSLLQKKCDGLSQFVKNTWFFSMSKNSIPQEGSLFHYREKFPTQAGIFFDKSCQSQETCHTSLGDNIKYILDNFAEKRKNTFLIIRDQSVDAALSKGKNFLARENLFAIDKIIKGLVNTTKLASDTLILVSGYAPRPIEMPSRGNQWIQFEKSGVNISSKQQSMLAPIFSYGANAENFCGIFPSNEIREKIFWQSKDRLYNLDFLRF
jgi:hypothetical protein